MTVLLSHPTDAEIRGICKEKIEALEHWLRRLIDDTLTPIYGNDYLSYVDDKGNRLIRGELSRQVEKRRAREPARYPRKIDAVLLEDAIAIICKPELFIEHFKVALAYAFPDGREEARTFFNRILAPRNNLAHANAISSRHAEQVICYSNDVIDSLKQHYRAIGMKQDYDVPLILKITDSFGQVFTRAQCGTAHDGGLGLNFTGQPHLYLRPGDTFTVELEIDPSYDPDSYDLSWISTKELDPPISGRRAVIPISVRHVGQSFDIQCRLTTKREWHRMHMGADDFLIIFLKVLPPIE